MSCKGASSSHFFVISQNKHGLCTQFNPCILLLYPLDVVGLSFTIYIILIYFSFLNKDGVPKGMLEGFLYTCE
jgi:hypothetical protein